MITIHIPKKSKGFNLSQELSTAKHIKDSTNRNSTLEGLNKIQQYL